LAFYFSTDYGVAHDTKGLGNALQNWFTRVSVVDFEMMRPGIVPTEIDLWKKPRSRVYVLGQGRQVAGVEYIGLS